MVFAITLLIGARLVVAAVQVAVATRRRRAHHRMVVDLLGDCRHGMHGLRVLDVSEPLAYCLPGVRSRVVLSQGTLSVLSDTELTAILSHERPDLSGRQRLLGRRPDVLRLDPVRPIGVITQPLIEWVNRPTFQQADEIVGHRP